MSDGIIIVGSSGHAKVIIDIIESGERYHVLGLLDHERTIGERTVGYSILGREETLPSLISANGVKGVIIAIGDNFMRSTVAERIRSICPDIPFIRAIHPKASIAKDVPIGEGAAIMPGVVVNRSASIGRFCILNTNSSLDHDSRMEDFSSLAPRATTGGHCHLAPFSAIGIGATVIHGISIGTHTVIGAGSTVLDNVESFCVAYGTPAKRIRHRNAGEKYL